MATPTPDINGLLLLMIAYFIIILLIHVLVMPFKRYIDNASYTLIYMLMLIIVTLEHYIFSTGECSAGLIWFEIFLSFLPFIFVAFYCLWKLLLAGGQIWKKYCHIFDKSQLVSHLLASIVGYIIILFIADGFYTVCVYVCLCRMIISCWIFQKE